MSKVLSKIAAAAALIVSAGAAHAVLIFEVSQFGGSSDPAVHTNVCNATTLALAGCTPGQFSVTTDFDGFQVVSFTAIVGDYAITTTSTTSNSPGDALEARVSTTALNVQRRTNLFGDAASLFIGVRAFDFTQPDGIFKTLTGSSGMSSPGGAGSGSITSTFWADADNAGGKILANQLSCTYPLAASADCGAGSLVWNDPLGSGMGKFSLRSEHSFNLTVGSRFEGTTSLVAGRIPEPMTASLVGVALLGLALASKRKAKTA